MSKVENEHARRKALIDKYGDSPPPLGTYPEIPPTGYALIVSYGHITTDNNNHEVYLGICPKIGWVMTRVHSDTYRGG